MTQTPMIVSKLMVAGGISYKLVIPPRGQFLDGDCNPNTFDPMYYSDPIGDDPQRVYGLRKSHEWLSTATFFDSTCGDNVIDEYEICDGTNLSGQSCTSLGFDSGTLVCASDCKTFDTSTCSSDTGGCSTTCGNGETCCTQGYTCETSGKPANRACVQV